MGRLDPRSLTTEPTMENLTDSEKLHLGRVIDLYTHHLHDYGYAEDTIKFHLALRDKLDLILFPQLREYE